LMGKRYLIHDHDPLYTAEFLGTLGAAGLACEPLLSRCRHFKESDSR
jgi:hypothetical protein